MSRMPLWVPTAAVRLLTLVSLAALALPATGWAGKHRIEGLVVDRNGQPLPRAVVSLTPGNVLLVTDREGRFLIDYLREGDGKRTRLTKKSQYTIEVFKVGFHTFTHDISYKRGPYEVDAVTMVEETIDITDLPENLDPQLYSRPTQSSGATYEGQ
ncbi:MAG: carboxypeptidase-like regulatory domain-containing protein [Myxococcales bacterium]|nr:carboxypeptidase-like regulatory domain-containing protein [Myxococcales bacterium]